MSELACRVTDLPTWYLPTYLSRQTACAEQLGGRCRWSQREWQLHALRIEGIREEHRRVVGSQH